jgi:hypothetical protein
VLFSSCKNDLQLNAPYKEIPFIYAVLNPQESRQLIRINKVFLGEGDANVKAKVADSVNYKEGEITVSLKRFENNTQVDATPGEKEIVFSEMMTRTDPGAFSQDQRIYFSDKKLFTYGEYRLTVKNNRTGNVFTAKANSLDSVSLKAGFRPLSINPSYPYPPGTIPEEYVDYTGTGKKILRFLVNSGKLYQVVIRTHFYDTSATKRFDYVDYNFDPLPEKDKEVFAGQTLMRFELTPPQYFSALGVALPRKNLPEAVYGRKVYMIEYLIFATTQEYADYLEYNSPKFSINQVTPLYSNFDNKAAYGIFTFRSRCSVKKEPSSTMINEFSRNSNTCNYRFYASDLTILGCQ